MTDRHNLRDKIARALKEVSDERLTDTEFEMFGDTPINDFYPEADAVLAVIDVDAVRAEAQVEALEDLATAHYLDGPQHVYDTIMRRADRIAHEVNIGTVGSVQCDQHKPVQHRDGKPPWCRACGKTAANTVPNSRFSKEAGA